MIFVTSFNFIVCVSFKIPFSLLLNVLFFNRLLLYSSPLGDKILSIFLPSSISSSIFILYTSDFLFFLGIFIFSTLGLFIIFISIGMSSIIIPYLLSSTRAYLISLYL